VNATLPSTQPIPNPLREQPDFAVPPALAAEMDEIIARYPRKRSASLMLLHALQERFGYLSRQAVEWVAAKLEVPPIGIYELVTFYPMFHAQPVGKYHVRICRTLSCALAGCYELHAFFCTRLGLDPLVHGPQTTADGKFTVEFVECLAGCDAAPVMVCNDAFHEGVTEQKAEALLAACK
jgi:NADH-quinone oxidoreductase subunit E